MKSRRLLLILLLVFAWISHAAARTNYGYSYVPKQVFQTQVFPVTIFTDRDSNGTPPTFTFDPKSALQPIDSAPLKDSNGGNTFYTFYFKAMQSDIVLPKLTITDTDGAVVLKSRQLPVKKLDTYGHETFCGLIATDCRIIASQISEFDAQNNLVSLKIKASEANPEEMHTPGSIESGIEKLTRKESESMIEYYFVIPSSQKNITISYYNTLQNRFISKTFSTDYKNKPVAAQENLNPKDSSFNKLKRYGLSFFSLFFLWMFWKKKEIFFLVLLAVCVLILLTLFIPHEKICVQEGAPLYILPTETSTTSAEVDRELITDSLKTRGNYHKIEYDHHTIGWIKDEDTCKN